MFYRGGNGPLRVSRGTSGNHLHSVFVEAGKQAGYPYTEDVNGYQQEGVGPFEMTIHKGKRWSAATAYLRPALKARPDRVGIEDNVLVHKVLFDGTKAIGVEFSQNGGESKKVRKKTREITPIIMIHGLCRFLPMKSF